MGERCGHDHDTQGLRDEALEQALSQAQRRCAEGDQRLTPQRRRVLELLLAAGQPVKAYDLIAGFGEGGEPAKPPTVYRALEFLQKQGFAHRIESLNAYVACRREADGHAAAFLICDCCGATREEAMPAGEISALGEAAGYQLVGVTVEAHGLCGDCRA
jgi:Fur family zinc uptake transcriptional regulator